MTTSYDYNAAIHENGAVGENIWQPKESAILSGNMKAS